MVLTRLFLDLMADMEMLIEEKPKNDVISAFFWKILLAHSHIRGDIKEHQVWEKNCKMDVLFSHHKGTCEDKYPCKDDEICVADHRADTHFCKCVIGRFRSPLKSQQLFV